jgi:hypothetical protein
LLVAGTAAAISTAAAPAQAVTFNLTDTGGTAVGSQARQGFEIAAYYWSSVLRDDATINLNIGFQALAPNILGQAGSTSTILFNSVAYGALSGDSRSSVDRSAVASLQPLGNSAQYGNNSLTVTTNALNAAGDGYIDSATRVDDDGSINNSVVVINTTQAKALGVDVDIYGRTIDQAASDGQVTFSSQFSFDFDPRDGVDAGAYDFIGVAIHEIGHILGFVSGVDGYDMYTSPGAGRTNPGALEGFAMGTILDYFRYSAEGRLDWSTQNTPYLSLDGGETQILGNSLMSAGSANGDNRSASHFRDALRADPQLGVMDPSSGAGQMQEVTALDLAAFDLIGWDIAFDPLTRAGYRQTTSAIYASFLSGAGAVPEPSTWAMMIGGFGVVGGALRSRRRNVRVSATFA